MIIIFLLITVVLFILAVFLVKTVLDKQDDIDHNGFND